MDKSENCASLKNTGKRKIYQKVAGEEKKPGTPGADLSDRAPKHQTMAWSITHGEGEGDESAVPAALPPWLAACGDPAGFLLPQAVPRAAGQSGALEGGTGSTARLPSRPAPAALEPRTGIWWGSSRGSNYLLFQPVLSLATKLCFLMSWIGALTQ